MKKILTLLHIFVSVYSFAQDYTKHELFVGYGTFPTINDNFSYPGDYKSPYGGIGTLISQNERELGSLNAGYLYSISKNFAVGLSYIYSSREAEYTLPNAAYIDAVRKDFFHIIMPNFKYQWLKSRFLTLYSKAAVGISWGRCHIIEGTGSFVTNGKSIENKRFLVWQVSPLGLELGNKHLAAFIEGGIGATGYVHTGIKVKL